MRLTFTSTADVRQARVTGMKPYPSISGLQIELGTKNALRSALSFDGNMDNIVHVYYIIHDGKNAEHLVKLLSVG